jgi:catechol 2,3-dioxygenase-like lactoylglutathione lyase family enzyme
MTVSRTAANHEVVERAVPNFPGDDLRIMKEFYVDRLGFRVVWEDSSSDGATGIMGLERGTIELVIDCPMSGHGRNVCLSLRVHSADAYYREWNDRVEIPHPPRNEVWNARTFGVTDPAGNLIFVVGPMETERMGDGQEDVVKMPSPRVTSLAPQFLVDSLDRSMRYYELLGFTFAEPWRGVYAIGVRDGLELHLKEAQKNLAERRHRREHDHLDAAGGVDGIEAFYDRCVANGVTIIRPLAPTPWGTLDFYIEDPDGYIIAFGGNQAG